jgi:cytochrome c556
MRRQWIGTTLAASLGIAALAAMATGHGDNPEHAAQLPAGPIRDRHELMEGIGKRAKAINGALQAMRVGDVAAPAEDIAADARKIATLFPAGSTHEKSRAKPEIWVNWAEFERLATTLADEAGKLAAVARASGDVKAAAKAVLATCKSCHDRFRLPD